MSGLPLFDAAGRRRSPATMPGYHAGREPRNKGRTYPADPPTVEEIVAVMRQAGEDRHGLRARALIVVLWRAALRIQEALSLTETDLDPNRCSGKAELTAGASAARSPFLKGGRIRVSGPGSCFARIAYRDLPSARWRWLPL